MPPELDAIKAAVRASWSKDTCDPDDLVDWSTKNPARGQCGATALTVNDLLGGDLLLAEVHHDDGTRIGFHYWNVLPDGIVVDLTREQFRSEEHVQAPRVVKRPPGPPRRAGAQYLVLRQRVLEAISASGSSART